jgi:hypothetical protein
MIADFCNNICQKLPLAGAAPLDDLVGNGEQRLRDA